MVCPFCYTVAYQNNGHFYSIQETLELIEVLATSLNIEDRDKESYFAYKCKECSKKTVTYHICTEHMAGVREIYL